MKSGKLKLVVLGMMGRSPFGGQTWLYLNWLLGFARLGHEVWYVEDDIVWPYDPRPGVEAFVDDCQYAVDHIRSCMSRVGLGDRWAFRFDHAKSPKICAGLTSEQLDQLYRDCDLLLNIVGATELRDPHRAAKTRVYVETDPVTLELRLAADPTLINPFDDHQVLFTYGENYGAPDCGVPLLGIDFRRTRQPIALDWWPMSFDSSAKHFTTIGNYRQGGADVTYNGQTYRWSKHHEWAKFIDLPSRTKQTFELAMMPKEKEDRDFLEGHGWNLVSPLPMSLDIFGEYPKYIRDSRAEFTVAKDQNIRLRSGWFSERDVCYLASGKPVVTQETGFSAVLPTGEGLFGFSTMDEALAGIESINADYARHCKAARALAESHFECTKIARKLLEEV